MSENKYTIGESLVEEAKTCIGMLINILHADFPLEDTRALKKLHSTLSTLPEVPEEKVTNKKCPHCGEDMPKASDHECKQGVGQTLNPRSELKGTEEESAREFLIKELNMSPLQIKILYDGYVKACVKYAQQFRSLSVSEKEVEENEKVKIYSEIIRDLKILRDNIGKPLAPKEISDEEIMAKANEWNDMFLMGLDDIDIQQFAEKLGKWYREKLKP